MDVRVIAATNRDLQQLIEQGEFLEDLYYRLNVINIQLAPLRQRREDIDVLANIFLHKYSQEAKRPIGGIAEEALHCLREYDWPGNIRELENAIERAVVLGVDDEIGLDDLPDQVLAAGHAAKSASKPAITRRWRSANGSSCAVRWSRRLATRHRPRVCFDCTAPTCRG